MAANKVAIITGSGRGIGAASAKLFAQHNYAVCINYKSDHQSAQQVADMICAEGGRCIIEQANVAVEQDVKTLFNRVEAELGQLTVLVNNAAILKPQMRLQDMSVQRIQSVLTNNILSCFLCCQEAVKRMSTKHGGNGGAIINVSSGAARSGSPNEYIDYAASKGAMDTLTIGLAKEVAGEGIRVNGVRPALIYTNMHADGGEATRIERLKSIIPLQRGGSVAEVAEAIYWLASDKSSFTTGSFIDVTGGL